MNIALVGCPGTGKTKFARSLKRDHGFVVIDNIAQKFSKNTGLMLGPYASWEVNPMLAGIRLSTEYGHRPNSRPMKGFQGFVATTTLIDSLVYSLWGTYRMEALDPANLTLDTINQPYYFSTLYLTRMIEECWNYDQAVFFPYKGDDEDFKEIDSFYLSVLDQKLPSFVYASEWRFSEAANS
jgi:hypothetical protein